MKKFCLPFANSFLIAVIFHLAILFSLNYFTSTKEAPAHNNGNIHSGNTIALNLGSTKKPGTAQKTTTVSPQAGGLTSAASPQTGTGQTSENGLGNGLGFEAVIVNYREPSYPPLAIKRNLQGNMRIKIFLSGEGQLKNVEVIESTGHSILDRAALDAVEAWSFKPHPNHQDYVVFKKIIFELK